MEKLLLKLILGLGKQPMRFRIFSIEQHILGYQFMRRIHLHLDAQSVVFSGRILK